ncbi:MAG TPA: tetratricopeptide repeat protein [Rhodocyclaceae bacterium]|nr:tetratricopeptide repeat protein [Rhodocyclaceae bacterium]
MLNFSRIKQFIKQLLLACTAVALSSLAFAADPSKADSSAPDKAQLQPSQELTGQILGELMLAEIAAARGQFIVASQTYLDLARRTRDARIARRATEIAVVGQQLEDAGEAAKIWVAVDPNSPTALQTFAQVMAGGYGKLEELEAPLAKLLSRELAPTEAILLELPRLYGRFPDKAAAAAAIERLTVPYQDMPEAQFARAVAYLAAEDTTRAEASAGRALLMRPDWEAAALLRAKAAPKERQTQAMEELNEFTKHYPQAREARTDYARWLITEKRLVDAGDAYRKLAADFPDDDDLAYNVAALAVQADDYATAEKQLRTLIDHKYHDMDLLHLQLGQVLEERQQPDEALTEYGLVGEGTHYVAAQARIAQVLVKRGQVDAAREGLHKAAAANPDDATEYVIVESQLLRQIDEPKPAQTVLKDFLAKQPDNKEVLYELAMLEEHMHQYDGMEHDLRHLIAIAPDFAHAYNALGYSFAERNLRLNDAETLLDQAIKLAPNDAAILDSVGWLRYRKGDLPGALDYLQRAYGLLPDPDVAAHVGEVLWMMGRKEDARRTWEDSRKVNPDSSALTDVMKRFTQ